MNEHHKRPSRCHSNRRLYNWLAYRQNDQMMGIFSEKIRGIVYDLGYGDMPYRQWVLQGADRYIGVDWASSLHELKADVLADLNVAVPLPDRSADTVISFSVMEHLH